MGITWSKEQLEAIQTVNKNILVSASAGAGKTTVLVQRIMKRILEDGVSLQNIVAMTFTEAAAAEIKKRLSVKLNEALIKQPSPFIEEQSALIATANISTIHAFCLNIIKDYYYVIGLDPAATGNIIDDALLSQYKQQALDQVLQPYFNKPSSDFVLLTDLLSARANDTDTLKTTILSLASAALKHADYQQWLNDHLNDYYQIRSIKQLDTASQQAFWSYLQVNIDTLKAIVAHLRQHLQQDLTDDLIAQIDHLQQVLDVVNHAVIQTDYQRFYGSLLNLAPIPFPVYKNKDDLIYPQLKKQYRDIIKNLLQDLFDEQTLIADLNHQYPALSVLVTLTINYIQTFKAIKNQHHGLDFDDMELFAYQILTANNHEVANSLKATFQEIMVDEFQDTNIMQNEIVNLISNGTNIFRVGDIKQSIYRFRGAKPNIMQQLIQEGDNNPLVSLIFLRNNFRSKQDIVNFNNAVFNHLMNYDYLNGSYTEFDNVTCGSPTQANDSAPVEFHFLHYDKEEHTDKRNMVKANYIAAKIIDLKKQGYQFKDFVVLVRSHAIKNYLKAAFDDANIPSFIPMNFGFYQSAGVQTVLSFIQLLLDTTDDIALVACLINLYSYTNDDLAMIKLNKGNTSYFDYLSQQQAPIIKDITAVKLFNPYHLTEILSYIFQINNYYEQRCSISERTNLDALFDKASSYQQKQLNLTEFYEMTFGMQDENIAEAISLNEDDDVVRVMTIHQSKGLQFPVVFLWSSNSSVTKTPPSSLVCHDELGFAFDTILLPYRLKRFNLKKTAISFKNQIEELEESIRLLYVALTRAQNRLYLVEAHHQPLTDGPLAFHDLFDHDNYSTWLYRLSTLLNMTAYTLTIHDNFSLDTLPKVPITLQPLPRYQGSQQLEPSMITPSKTHQQQSYDLDLNGIDYAAHGTKIHELISILPSDNWHPELLLQLEPSLSTTDIKQLMAFYHSDFYQQLKHYQIDKEVPFYVMHQGNVINGIIDFLALNDQQCIIIDFKTDFVNDASILVSRYQQQLQYYMLAAKTLYPNHNISSYLYSFTLDQFIKIEP